AHPEIPVLERVHPPEPADGERLLAADQRRRRDVVVLLQAESAEGFRGGEPELLVERLVEDPHRRVDDVGVPGGAEQVVDEHGCDEIVGAERQHELRFRLGESAVERTRDVAAVLEYELRRLLGERADRLGEPLPVSLPPVDRDQDGDVADLEASAHPATATYASSVSSAGTIRTCTRPSPWTRPSSSSDAWYW